MRSAADSSRRGLKAAPANRAAAPGAAFLPEEIFAAAIRLINRELVPEASAKQQRIYGKVTRLLSRLQRKAQRHSAHSPVSQTQAIASTSGMDWRTWGLALRRRREEAGLTRKKLALLADVSDATIRNIETGRHAPTRIITSRLQGVSGLNLPVLFADSPSASAGEPGTTTPAPDALRGHCWIAPDFDAIEQSRELARLLRGSGGRIDPALLFLDPASAAAWCSLSSKGERLRARVSMPRAAVARAVFERLAGASVDVLGLGAGEAHAETSLAQLLCASQAADLRLLLLDLSPSLLNAGFRHARSALAGLNHTGCFAIQGDMRKLPSYGPILESKRRRLVCMFGDTFNTLDNEATFTRHSLSALSAGDLLLLDVPLALAEPQDELHLRPDALARPEAAPLIEFLAGPIYRHGAAARSVALSTVIDHTACIIPGGYAVEYLATVRAPSRASRRFSLYHAKRYVPERLVESLARMGWDSIERWPFGETHSPRALLLLQKRA